MEITNQSIYDTTKYLSRSIENFGSFQNIKIFPLYAVLCMFSGEFRYGNKDKNNDL